MARLKRNSRTLAKAEQRIVGLKSIDEALDFGNGLNLAAYSESLEAARRSIEAYNAALLAVDAAKSVMADAEKKLSYLNEYMLLAVATRYGKDSIQYKKGGGIPKQERKRPRPRGKTIAA
jgi:hypothetical protein